MYEWGGTLRETVLWTNASPTSQMAETSITLSEDITNFDYIKIYWRLSTTNDLECSILVEPTKISHNNVNVNAISITSRSTGSSYGRVIYVGNTNDIIFVTTAAVRGGSSLNNGMAIITKISGLNI